MTDVRGYTARGYANTRHGQVHYRTAGDGPPLILLHATPHSSRVYKNLVPLLAPYFRVIAPDTLGFGYSDPLPADVSMEKLAESCADLMAALSLPPAAVFGLHTGNKVGAALAAGWGDRVSHFICCGMTHSIVVEREKRDRAIKVIIEKSLSKEQPSADGSHMLRSWGRTFDGISHLWWSPPVVDAFPLREQVLQDTQGEAIDRIVSRPSFDAIYQANFAFDLSAALASLVMPSLIVELVVPGEAHLGRQAEACVRLNRRSQAVTLEYSDRDVLERVPDILAGEILRFLAATPAR